MCLARRRRGGGRGHWVPGSPGPVCPASLREGSGCWGQEALVPCDLGPSVWSGRAPRGPLEGTRGHRAVGVEPDTQGTFGAALPGPQVVSLGNGSAWCLLREWWPCAPQARGRPGPLWLSWQELVWSLETGQQGGEWARRPPQECGEQRQPAGAWGCPGFPPRLLGFLSRVLGQRDLSSPHPPVCPAGGSWLGRPSWEDWPHWPPGRPWEARAGWPARDPGPRGEWTSGQGWGGDRHGQAWHGLAGFTEGCLCFRVNKVSQDPQAPTAPPAPW